jgi:hypothetical protein
MEQLPYIDEHSILIEAAPARAWEVLVSTLRADLGGPAPAPLRFVLGIQPTDLRGDWRETPHPGDCLPGFAVAESRAPKRLALHGHHRFSRYALVFELDTTSAGHCTLRAQTRAEFPGVIGPVYRALVIGSGVHRLVVRRLLHHAARRA